MFQLNFPYVENIINWVLRRLQGDGQGRDAPLGRQIKVKEQEDEKEESQLGTYVCIYLTI